MEFGSAEELLVLKVSCRDVNRRLTVRKSSDLSLSVLQSHLRELCKLPENSSLFLSYCDAEGDDVALEDDRDLRDAIVLQRLNPLRLKVEAVEEEKEETEEVGDEKEDGAQEAKESDAEEQQRVQLRLESAGIRVLESYRARDVLLLETVKKVMDLLEAAVRNRSPFLVEVSFPPPPPPPLLRPTVSFEEGTKEGRTTAAQRRELASAFGSLTRIPSNGAAALSLSLPSDGQEGGGVAVDEEGAANGAGGGGGGGVASPSAGGTTCGVCKQSPINGPRYQSLIKPDYELCYACFTKHGTDIQFRKAPSSRRGLKVHEKLVIGERIDPIHDGIECDACRTCPIIGPRYKSTVLPDFDLCEVCFLKEGEEGMYDRITQPVTPSPRTPHTPTPRLRP